ncbi:hypothetical protein QQY66_47655 [Streptomyces sp. DG2A-72]|uniref:hypothetical protein n=1 Tax=Streptomyces sp. DG2A-72 TaxID=3051386 RepID=UPI00265C1120|nr:hypothetical protein [Streptomyces sp. DG2A-72]MDO0939020.1 hypothetical protein [Streptomyces sp. DG2A-72]
MESLGTVRSAESGETCTILPCSVVAVHGDPRRLGVRRIADPVLRRYIAVRTAMDRYEPRAAIVVVRRGIVEVTREPAAAGRLPSIHLT